jgi:DNA-binding LacI/PurR family transcriptional regulator
MRNYQIAAHVDIRDSEVSRVLTGNGYISDAICQKVVDAKEPKESK